MSGSTNNKIREQNKQVEKQYKQDKAYYDYQNSENRRKYEDAVKRTQMRQFDLDAQAEYRDQTNRDRYEYASDVQRQEFQIEKDVYNQSLKDYDYQFEANSMAGAMAQEAEDRALDESLIKRNFDLQDQDLAFDRARFQKNFIKAANEREIKYAAQNLAADKADNASQRAYLQATAANDLKINAAREKQINNDIKFIKDKLGWDLEKADLTFNKAQASNFVQRINSMVEKEKSVGSARAAGREGLSAEYEVTNALAEYGRNQAALVDNLVFAKDDKILTKKVATGTANYQVANKKIDKSILATQRDQINTTLTRGLEASRYRDSKLDLAFNEAKENAMADTERAIKEFKFTRKEINYNRDKIRTSFDSAKLQYQFNSERIKLDQYSANYAAWSKIPLKPKAPPQLPVPYKTPRTVLPLPLEPTKPPKPIKGALGKTSVWNDVGDALNVGLQIASIAIPFI